MNNSNQNAEVAQGVAQANAENNSVKTNENEVANVATEVTEVVKTAQDLNKERMNALFAKHKVVIEAGQENQADYVEWFVPSERDTAITTRFHAQTVINDKPQNLLEVINKDSLVRLPDSFEAFVKGKSAPAKSFGGCKRLVRTLINFSSHYDKALSLFLNDAYNLYMRTENVVKGKEVAGLNIVDDYKDQYGNIIKVDKVWRFDHRNAMQDIVDEVINYIVDWQGEHPKVPMLVSPRSNEGKSAIIEKVIQAD